MRKQKRVTVTTERELTVLRRYALKGDQAGRVVSVVRSTRIEKNITHVSFHKVLMLSDGRYSCDCEARKCCCHIWHVQACALRRCDSVSEHNRPSAVTPVSPVVESPVKPTRKSYPAGTLNGNRPFFLPKSYREIEAERLAKTG